MFHILERETLWRQEQGRPPGFAALQAQRPVVALGAEEPLEDQTLLSDYFREWSRDFFSHSPNYIAFLISIGHHE
jgi:hypothetical protein